MLYLFTWNSQFLLREQINAWRKAFIEKHGDLNFIHIKDITEVNNDFLLETLCWLSFMNQKRLVIIDNIPSNLKTKDTSVTAKQELLAKLLSKIPEDNIVVFSSINPDKRSKFLKELTKVSTIKEFSIKWEFDIKNLLMKRYQNKIDVWAINLIIKYKSGNIDKIIWELDKLEITRDFIYKKDIEENILPELEESIFILLDDLLNSKVVDSIDKMRIMLWNSNVYAFYNNLIANLRTQIFIVKMKKLWVIKSQIISELKLWNRWFLVDKNYNISFEKLTGFYINLINLDKKMKTWKMIWTKDKDFIFELEKTVLSII